MVHEHFFVRNTKISIGSDYVVPDTREEVYFLKLSSVERGIYEAVARSSVVDDTRLRQVCCHPQISNEDQEVFGVEQKSLEEVRRSHACVCV